MCGILTVVNKTSKELDLASCRRALSYLTLRGPDLTTYKVWDGHLFLGQTILSITGNIPKDDQHLSSVSGSYQLVLNGEIYNYQELKTRWLDGKVNIPSYTGTDTQVLVNLHEILPARDIPKLLDGMYAYTIWDKKRKTLSISRDIQGEKSLYIYEDKKVIIVSSEISPILCLIPSLKPDPQVLRDYFHTRHFMFLERTLYKGIRQLLPGQWETLDLKTMNWGKPARYEISSWISPEKMKINEKRSPDDLTDEMDALMVRTVKEMIPQGRKFAAVVSGGVDSSLIAYYVKKLRQPDVLVAVDHIGKDKISMDLSRFEKVLDQKINILHVDALAYSSEIMRCQKVCRGPLFAHSFVGQAIQSAFVRAQGCRVLFGGDGADEILGGYPCYVEKREGRGKFSPSPYTTFYQDANMAFKVDHTKTLEKELAGAWQKSLAAYQHLEDKDEQTVQAMMHCDFTWQLPCVGLRGSDLMSLMWNIETRSFFVRRPIVELL